MTKILYVEDNEDNIYMLSRRLKGRILTSLQGMDKLVEAAQKENRYNSDGP